MNFKNPLLERMGAAFFRQIPQLPGVYTMSNEQGEIIYVGKAKCLRSRLRSYTRVNADNSSRKVLRLVHFAKTIQWEILPDEKSALLRENYLLRTLDPTYNVVNTSPHTYLFFHLRFDKKFLALHLAMETDPSYPHIYGAFKGLGTCYRAHKALFRLLWMSFHECRHGFELPGHLTNHKKLNHYRFPLPEELSPELHLRLESQLKRFLNGTSKSLLVELVDRLLAREDLARFTRELIQEDLQTLLEFYERCAHRNRRIKRKLGLASPLIAQDEVDDFVVLAGN